MLPPKPRNLHTQALNRRESLWQIYLPLAGVGLIGLVLIGLLIGPASFSTRSVWADVSLIYLVVVTGLLSLIGLVVLAVLCVGLGYVLRKLPPYFKLAQDFMLLVVYRTAEYSKQVTDAIIAPRAALAAVQDVLLGAGAWLNLGRKDK